MRTVGAVCLVGCAFCHAGKICACQCKLSVLVRILLLFDFVVFMSHARQHLSASNPSVHIQEKARSLSFAGNSENPPGSFHAYFFELLFGADAATESHESISFTKNPQNFRSVANWQVPTIFARRLSHEIPDEIGGVTAPEDAVARQLQAQGRRARDRPAPSQVVAGEQHEEILCILFLCSWRSSLCMIVRCFVRRSLFIFVSVLRLRTRHGGDWLSAIHSSPVPTPSLSLPTPHPPPTVCAYKTTRSHASRRSPSKHDLPPLPMYKNFEEGPDEGESGFGAFSDKNNQEDEQVPVDGADASPGTAWHNLSRRRRRRCGGCFKEVVRRYRFYFCHSCRQFTPREHVILRPTQWSSRLGGGGLSGQYRRTW